MTGTQIKKIAIGIGVIIAIDLVMKSLIVNSFEPTEMKEVVGSFLSIGRIQTVRGAFGFQNSGITIFASHLAFQLVVVILALRLFRREVHWTFAVASLMIIAGWIGDYADWILFSGGNTGYVSTEYFYFHFFPPVLSLSVVITTLGWVLLIFGAVVYFKDLKRIFQKAA